MSPFWGATILWCETIIRPKTPLICGEDLSFFWSLSAFGPKTQLICGEDLFFWSQSVFGHNVYRSRSQLRKRHMAKGDTTKPRSGCHREIDIPSRVPPFLTTPLSSSSKFEYYDFVELLQSQLHCHREHATLIRITFYSPSCVGQKTAKGPFGLWVKSPPALLSTTHGGGFTLHTIPFTC